MIPSTQGAAGKKVCTAKTAKQASGQMIRQACTTPKTELWTSVETGQHRKNLQPATSNQPTNRQKYGSSSTFCTAASCFCCKRSFSSWNLASIILERRAICENRYQERIYNVSEQSVKTDQEKFYNVSAACCWKCACSALSVWHYLPL